jgi:hypothetical protein
VYIDQVVMENIRGLVTVGWVLLACWFTGTLIFEAHQPSKPDAKYEQCQLHKMNAVDCIQMHKDEPPND